MSFFGSLYDWVYRMAYSQPPHNAQYGYRWQAGQGVPATLGTFDPAATPPGVYVAFMGDHLEDSLDPFGRDPGEPGTVYPQPVAVLPAVTNLVNSVARNPPPNETGWTHPPAGRLADIGGFLAYGATCLDLLDQTAAGHTLLTTLSSAPHATFIKSTLRQGGNQTVVGAGAQDWMVDALTRAAKAYSSGAPVPANEVNAAVPLQYAHIPGVLAKWNQLAADMNAAPLYTLFQAAGASPPHYLYSFFRFRNRRLTGADLRNWCSSGGFGAFDATLRGMTTRRPDGVQLRDMFLVALCVALYPVAPRGPGLQASISFSVRNEFINVQGAPDFRPPAIGLAHELMHALHYTRGSSPGYDFKTYSTTAAELMFTGIGPSATEPLNENAIRAQWAALNPPIDPSNQWANPVPRLVYEPPVPPETPAFMRESMNCL